MHASPAVALVVAALAGAATCATPEPVQPTSPRAAALAAGDTVQLWLTTGNKSALLARQPTLTFASGSNNNATITVNGATTYQTMDGFGYTLTGGSAIVINRMPAAARSALLGELFTRN